MGVALLLPRTFSDPDAVDPFTLRVSIVALALAAFALWRARLAAVRAALVSLLAIALPFSTWLLTPDAIAHLGWRWLYSQEALAAGVMQLVITAALIPVIVRTRPRVCMRMRHLSVRGLAVAAFVCVILSLLAFAVPGDWLGRVGIQPVALRRDLPYFIPGCIALALGQEIAFRGMLMGSLESWLPRAGANALQAVVFSFAHIAVQYEGPAGTFIPITLLLGLGLGYLVQRSESLWPAVLVHSFLDVGATVVVMTGLYGSTPIWAPVPGATPLHAPALRASTPGSHVTLSASGATISDRRGEAVLQLLPLRVAAGSPAVTGLATFRESISDAVYAATSGAGVLASVDGGVDWFRFGDTLPAKVTSVWTDGPQRAVYVDTAEGVFVHHVGALPRPPSYSWHELLARWGGTAVTLISVIAAGLWGLRRMEGGSGLAHLPG